LWLHSQGRTAAAQCGLFKHKSVPVIFEPPCTWKHLLYMHDDYAAAVDDDDNNSWA